MKQIGRRCNKLYRILDIPRDADKKKIKKAYLEKAKIFHPDVGGDEKQFLKIQEAFQVLSDPYKKLQYDQTGSYENVTISEQTQVEQAANGMIASYFRKICEEKKEQIIFLDIIEMISQTIKKDIREKEKQVLLLNGGLRLVNDILGRTEYKGRKINIIEGVLLNVQEENEMAIADLKRQIKYLRAALKLLESYSFEPKMREMNPSYTILNTTSTSGC